MYEANKRRSDLATFQTSFVSVRKNSKESKYSACR